MKEHVLSMKECSDKQTVLEFLKYFVAMKYR